MKNTEKRQSKSNEDTYKTNVTDRPTNQKRNERLKQTKDATD